MTWENIVRSGRSPVFKRGKEFIQTTTGSGSKVSARRAFVASPDRTRLQPAAGVQEDKGGAGGVGVNAESLRHFLLPSFYYNSFESINSDTICV